MEHAQRICHGEYKIPGGKLVVADFVIENQHIKNLQISGDFFLEPPEVLEQITAAIEGESAAIDRDELAQKISAAIDPNASLFGIHVEGIVVVIERALA